MIEGSPEVNMRTCARMVGITLSLALASAILTGSRPALAASARAIDRDVEAALQRLYDQEPGAQALAAQAKGILVFPSVVKGGFMVGGQYGEGALRQGGKTAGYYSTVAASYGLQVGLQVFGYALFFMTDSALTYLEQSEGWEIGSGPSLVIVDTGMARALTTTTLQQDVYAFFFSQKGLMAGLGLQGSKITQIER